MDLISYFKRQLLKSLTLFLLIPALAAGLELGNFSTAPAEGKELKTPHPLHLEPNWWSYFSAGDLENKVKEQEKKLKELELSIQGEDRPQASGLIERYLVTLKAFSQMKKPPSLESAPPKELPQKYPLQRLLDLLVENQEASLKIKDQQEDLEQMNRSLESAKAHLDHLAIDYQANKAASAEKLLLGLEMMSTKAGAVLLGLRIKNDEGRLNSLKADNQAMKEELIFGEEKLDLGALNLSQIETEMSALEKEIAAAEGATNQAESKLINFYASANQDNPLYPQLLLSATEAKVQEGISKSKLILLENERALIDLSDGNPQSLAALKDSLSRTEQALQKLQDSSEDWLNSTKKARNAAQVSFLEAAKAPDRSTRELAKVLEKRINTSDSIIRDIQKLASLIEQGKFLTKAVERRFYTRETTFKALSLKVSSLFLDFWTLFIRSFTATLFRINDMPITAFDMIRTILIFLGALYGSYFVQEAIKRIGYQQKNIAPATFYTLGRLAHYTILIFGLVIGLSSIGLNFTNLAIVAGALSVGIGFGLQSIVNNFLSGLIILFERNLKVGDFLELETGHTGRVLEINVRSTIIHTGDGIDVVVPNSDIIGGKVFNWTMTDEFRLIKVPFGVGYSSDKSQVKKVILEVAERMPCTLKNNPKYSNPDVRLVNLGDSSLDFELVTWVDAYASRRLSATKAAYLWEIHTALEQNKIEIPFRQQEIILKRAPKE
ncbi:MAG: MscS Mechanosensitive ion channel [Chlamydiales bacterium]|jgi:small-conductance mechanosensitive channel|nr:MscS Mechanosensitive ion channel [Chlamydiales bacterium]